MSLLKKIQSEAKTNNIYNKARGEAQDFTQFLKTMSIGACLLFTLITLASAAPSPNQVKNQKVAVPIECGEIQEKLGDCKNGVAQKKVDAMLTGGGVEVEAKAPEPEEPKPEEKKEEEKKEEPKEEPKKEVKIEEKKVEKVKEEEKPAPKSQIQSKYLARWFKDKTGQMHMDTCLSKEVGRKFVDAFAEFGHDNQVIACVTLNHENALVNGQYVTDAVSPCWSTNATLAHLRKCDYASDNGAGVDAGLFMINTYHQAGRITKLGGPACYFGDSRNPSDPCNVKKMAWLHDVDNQIKIIKDIYREQGFTPWVAFLNHVKRYT